MTFVNVELQDVASFRREGVEGGYKDPARLCESANVGGSLVGRAGKMGERVVPITKARLINAVAVGGRSLP